MKLKLHRTVRTQSSEEIYIYDLDLNDEAGEAVDIGKMDVHYTADQIVGTVLFWKDWHASEAAASPNLQPIVDEVLEELAEPLGVSGEYDIEYYICDRDSRQFVSNIDDEFDFEEDEGFDEEEEFDEEEDEEIKSANGSTPTTEGNGSTQR